MSLTINNIDHRIAACEAMGLSKVFAAYEQECCNEWIEDIGFNPNSGYVYIALENTICICSNLGSDVEYLVTNYNNGDEKFFEDYQEAEEYLESLNKEEDGEED